MSTTVEPTVNMAALLEERIAIAKKRDDAYRRIREIDKVLTEFVASDDDLRDAPSPVQFLCGDLLVSVKRNAMWEGDITITELPSKRI